MHDLDLELVNLLHYCLLISSLDVHLLLSLLRIGSLIVVVEDLWVVNSNLDAYLAA